MFPVVPRAAGDVIGWCGVGPLTTIFGSRSVKQAEGPTSDGRGAFSMGQAGCAASARDYCRTVLVRYSTYTVAPAAWIRASFDRAEVPDCDGMVPGEGKISRQEMSILTCIKSSRDCLSTRLATRAATGRRWRDVGSLQGQDGSRSTRQLRNGPGLGIKVIRVWRSLLPLAGNVKVRHEPGKLETSN